MTDAEASADAVRAAWSTAAAEADALVRSRPRLGHTADFTVPPGTTFDYDNCGAHLLGVHLADRLGDRLENFAAGTLFPAIGVTRWTWPTDPDGYNFGFGHLQLLPDDLLAVARLLLHGGRDPEGRQVVAADWVAAMTTAQTARDTVVPVLVAAADRIDGPRDG